MIGFSLACRVNPKLAEINSTVILPEHQHQGYIAKLMSSMEDELRVKGFTEMERYSRVLNGYAGTIERHYGDRIISSSFVDPDCKLFRIKL